MPPKIDFKRDLACYRAARCSPQPASRSPPRTARPDSGDLRLEPLTEGRCVQALHVGPFDEEAELLRRMHDEVIPRHGFTMVGKHHEIYLSDPRKTEPAKLRTILRQPVMPVT